jgi:hypothetical protein
LYTGEVVGEAVFGGIAMMLTDPDRQPVLEVLRLLEAQTEHAMRPLAERCGVTHDQVVQARRDGWNYALLASDDDGRWAQVIDGLVQSCPGIVARFERLCELAPATDAAVAEALVAHEVALFEFAQREVSRARAPLEPVLMRLHGRYRAVADASLA